MDIALTLVLVVLFLLMNAFFVIAEFALVRVRKSQLEMAVENNTPGAQAALDIANNVNAYLSACQLGITLASLALGWLGEPAFSSLIRPVLSLFAIPNALISAIAVAIGYIIMTALHVVAGELIPKSFAIFSTQRYACMTAAPLKMFYKITYPVMWLFNTITTGVVRLFGHDPSKEREVYTGEEIQLLIDESTESGLIEPHQNKYMNNIFDLEDKDAQSIMTPRTDIVCIDLEDSVEENIALIRQYKFTRYPVCRGNKDRVTGFVHVKDLIGKSSEALFENLPIREIEAVSENLSISKLLRVMQGKHDEMVIVVDEHGGTAGIVTITDIIEQFIGRLEDEYIHGMPEEVVKIRENMYLLDGSLPIDKLIALLGFEPQEAEECETVGGLVLTLLDRIPDEGEACMVKDALSGTRATFKVEEMDRHRVEQIKLFIHRGENG